MKAVIENIHRFVLLATLAAGALSLASNAQSASSQPAAPSPFTALQFLEGTWQANTGGANGVTAAGTYTFREELGHHVLARHSSTAADGCKGPADFDCNHGDLLYLYQDAPGQPLKAIYFDNEGHTLRYAVTTPDAATAIFMTDPAQPGPQFRLVYKLDGGVMSGKFQVKPPGAPEWHSYLEWSGKRIAS